MGIAGCRIWEGCWRCVSGGCGLSARGHGVRWRWRSLAGQSVVVCYWFRGRGSMLAGVRPCRRRVFRLRHRGGDLARATAGVRRRGIRRATRGLGVLAAAAVAVIAAARAPLHARRCRSGQRAS